MSYIVFKPQNKAFTEVDSVPVFEGNLGSSFGAFISFVSCADFSNDFVPFESEPSLFTMLPMSAMRLSRLEKLTLPSKAGEAGPCWPGER